MVIWLEQLWQDVRYGCRMLARAPGFTSDRRPLARDRHRRQLRDLQLCRRAAAAAAPGRPAGRGRDGRVDDVDRGASARAASPRRTATTWTSAIAARASTASSAFTYVTAGFASRPGAVPTLKMGMLVSGNLFRVMGVEPALGRRLPARRGSGARPGRRRRARPRAVGAAVRIRPVGPRPARGPQRPPVHGDWRRARASSPA